MNYHFTREEILDALHYLDNNKQDFHGRTSVLYDLVYQGKFYPPILVLSKANELKENEAITIRDFNNSTEKAFKILRNLGFDVLPKEKKAFSKYLLDFIKQSDTDNLKFKDYSIDYLETKVKASFGQGTPARIPWISFLIPPNTTSDGIYPVYLYYKDQGVLILAFGVSETTVSKYNWQLDPSTLTVKQVFEQSNLEPPFRYGDSLVYKVYKVDSLPENIVLDQDLDQIITIYKNQIGVNANNPQEQKTTPVNTEMEAFDYSYFNTCLSDANLHFNDNLVKRFIASLITKPFVILTGLAGSGKTKLAQSFIQWLSVDYSQYKIVPVGADWINPEPLLGYPNGLITDQYVTPDNGVLDLMIESNKSQNKDKPYFLVLDEMNLSHVERYFADFLSIMESKEAIHLYSGSTRKSTSGEMIPLSITWPSNLFIIGTVNIDETTYMFSPKVLDRANVIEFRIDTKDLEKFLNSPKDVQMQNLVQQGITMANSFLELSNNKSSGIEKRLNTILIDLFGVLSSVGAEFGYRSAYEINLLFNQFHTIDPKLSFDQKVDFCIMQKLLPKLHGSRSKIAKPLELLMQICLKDPTIFSVDKIESMPEENIKYEVSFNKLKQMYFNAISNGFTSYAEA